MTSAHRLILNGEIHDGQVSIDSWVEAQSDDRKLVALERAARELGIPLADLDPDDTAIADAWAWQMRLMAAQDFADGEIAEGRMAPSVNADGSLSYDPA